MNLRTLAATCIAALMITGCGGSDGDGEGSIKTFSNWQSKYHRNASITDEALAELPPGVTELEANGCKYATDAGIAHLAKQTAIRKLWISEAQITDAGLKTIGGLITLEDLSLQSDAFTDAGIAHLASLKNLKHLSLHGKNLTAACLAHLKGLTNLEEFQPSLDFRLDDAAMESLGELSKLKELFIFRSTITDKGGVHLGKMVGLTKLHMSDMEITDVTLDAMKNLPALKELIINGCQKVTHEGIGRLGSLPALEDLSLIYAGNYGGPGTAGLKNAPKLKKLRITGIKSDDAKHLAELTQLDELSFLEASGVNDEHLVHLASMANLKSVDLYYTSVTSIASLEKLTGLTQLNLSNTKVTDEGFKEVAKLVNLKELYIGDTLITSLEPIKELKALEKIALPDGMDQRCIDILVGLPALKTIYIDDKAKVSKEDVDRLKKAFPQASIWSQFR